VTEWPPSMQTPRGPGKIAGQRRVEFHSNMSAVIACGISIEMKFFRADGVCPLVTARITVVHLTRATSPPNGSWL
jgi:hypothetical protein